MTDRDDVTGNRRRVILVGAGVVGRSIAAAHLTAGVPIELVDTNLEMLDASVAHLRNLTSGATEPESFTAGGWLVRLNPKADPMPRVNNGVLVIESIVERREPKRDLIAAIDDSFGDDAIFATNTSSLRLADLESATKRPQNFCGLHFFMPVDHRPMVEVVRAAGTGEATLAAAEAHVRRIDKQPLRVADSPGFVVNRILSPYLNQAMLLLGSGADPNAIRCAATEFGMPFSPLELVDWIGARTAFDAGRAFWQAFPYRIDPAPVLPGMIKAGLRGRAAGCGFYDYDSTTGELVSPETLSAPAQDVVQRYRRGERSWSLQEISHQLTLPMLIEAACLLAERVVESPDAVEAAMRGGLGFQGGMGFFETFDRTGTASIAERSREWGPHYKAMQAPEALLQAFDRHDNVRSAVVAFVG